MVEWSSISVGISTASSRGSTTRIGSCTFASSARTNNTTPSTRKRFERYSMNIKPIRTKANYRAALEDIESLMMAKGNTPEGDRLDVLTTLVEAYERKHFPMDLPDAVEAI